MDEITNYNSYLNYKTIHKERQLENFIYRKYLPLLGSFIESMYKGLKFDIFVKKRNFKERRLDWYGMTYMELIIFDVIKSPVYNPMSFEPVYITPHYDGFISGDFFFEDINSYIPDINQHLAISFTPVVNPYIDSYNQNFNDIPTYECWKEYFKMESMYNNRIKCNWDNF